MYFTSKSLTEAQRGYAAIELESLAVAWAMEKFHHFFMVITSCLKLTKALGDHPIKKLESSYTQIAKDTQQNLSLQF